MTQRTPAQPGNAPKKTSLPAVDPFIKPTPQLDTLTAHGVVQLQRVIGNQGVQRLMSSQLPTQTRVQRSDDSAATAKPKNDDKDDGFLGQDTTNGFAQKVQDYARTNKTGYLGPLKTEMMKAINVELQAMGIPETMMSAQKPSGALGDVITKNWKIMVDMDTIFGETADKISDVTDGQIVQAAGVVYKQARRLEQYYRIAQLNVAELKKENWSDELILTHLTNMLDVPESVVRAAIADPLRSDIDPKLLEKIKAWAASLYGSNKDYRELIDELNPIIAMLRSSLSTIFNLIPGNYATLSPEEQQTIQTLLKPHLKYLETYLNEFNMSLSLNLTPLLQLMQDRNASESNAEGTLIIGHLTTLEGMANTIPAFSQLPVMPNGLVKAIPPIQLTLADIAKELTDAKNDLPEQRDMRQAAGEARKAIKQQFTINP